MYEKYPTVLNSNHVMSSFEIKKSTNYQSYSEHFKCEFLAPAFTNIIIEYYNKLFHI